ncbi:unnamed protein product [Mortierella alpina]
MLLKLSAVALFVASSAVAFPSFIQSQNLAPIVSSLDAHVVPDSYVVVFKSGVRAADHSPWVHSLHKRDLSVNGIGTTLPAASACLQHGSVPGNRWSLPP